MGPRGPWRHFPLTPEAPAPAPPPPHLPPKSKHLPVALAGLVPLRNDPRGENAAPWPYLGFRVGLGLGFHGFLEQTLGARTRSPNGLHPALHPTRGLHPSSLRAPERNPQGSGGSQ